MVRGRPLSARALWGLASWAAPLSVVFVVTPTLLRVLGAERFGVLMIVLVVPLLASQFDLGLASTAVRRLASGLATGKVHAGRTLFTWAVSLGTIGLLLGALAWISAAPLARWLGFDTVLGSNQAVRLLRWCAAWVVICAVTQLPGLLARSAQALALIAAAQTLSAGTLWIGAWWLVTTLHPLEAVVGLGISVTIAASLVTIIALRDLVEWKGPVFVDLKLLATERSFSAGVFASQIAGAVVYQGDRILVSAVGSPAIAGTYALCANLANKTLAAVVALTAFVFPHAARLHARGERDEIYALLRALDRGVAIIVMPLLLPGWALSAPFLRLWLGPFGTAEVAAVFRILWLAFVLATLAVPVGHVIVAQGNSRLPARFAWLTAIVVVLSIALLVPQWNALGAAMAMLLGMTTSLVFNVAARRSLSLGPAPGRVRFLSGIAFGLVAQAAVLLAAHGHVDSWLALLGVAAVAIIAFHATRAIFRLLSPEETRLLERVLKRRQVQDNPE